MSRSAGLLMFRSGGGDLEVLLVHPGGPLFARKDEGSWTIPKGLIDDDEHELEAAKREFEEETSYRVTATEFIPLGSIRQKSGKLVDAWAFEGDWDPHQIRSNTFELEWPPRSGTRKSFPEIDRGEWFDVETARRMIIPAQQPFLDRLEAALQE